jgi:ribonuclease T2
MRFVLPLLTALALSTPALAAPACSIPKGLTPAPVEAHDPSEVVSHIPTAYYLLAITWTPDWRRINGQTKATSPALDPETRPQGFALHGLWPNGEVGPPYPRYCRPVGTIEASTVRSMYCRTPSAALLQHEWQAHGACGWDKPADYFRDAARLYDRITLPRIEAIPDLTAGKLRQAFVKKNRGLPASAIFVALDKEDRLTEVRLCYDLKYRATACPGSAGAADDRRVRLTPSSTGRL